MDSEFSAKPYNIYKIKNLMYSPFEPKRKEFDLTSLRKNVTAISTGERLFRDFATAYSIDPNRVSPANPPEMNEKIF